MPCPIGRSMLPYVTAPYPAGAASFQRSWQAEPIPHWPIAGANPTKRLIREQLDRILNSCPFHLQAPRRQRFLEYIVK